MSASTTSRDKHGQQVRNPALPDFDQRDSPQNSEVLRLRIAKDVARLRALSMYRRLSGGRL
jgi:hypothetical protein